MVIDNVGVFAVRKDCNLLLNDVEVLTLWDGWEGCNNGGKDRRQVAREGGKEDRGD